MNAEVKTVDWRPAIAGLKRNQAVRDYIKHHCLDAIDREDIACESLTEGDLYKHHFELLELALAGDELEIGRRVRDAMLNYVQACQEKREHLR